MLQEKIKQQFISKNNSYENQYFLNHINKMKIKNYYLQQVGF